MSVYCPDNSKIFEHYGYKMRDYEYGWRDDIPDYKRMDNRNADRVFRIRECEKYINDAQNQLMKLVGDIEMYCKEIVSNANEMERFDFFWSSKFGELNDIFEREGFNNPIIREMVSTVRRYFFDDNLGIYQSLNAVSVKCDDYYDPSRTMFEFRDKDDGFVVKISVPSRNSASYSPNHERINNGEYGLYIRYDDDNYSSYYENVRRVIDSYLITDIREKLKEILENNKKGLKYDFKKN